MSDLIVSNITNNFSVSIINKPQLNYGIVAVSQPGLNSDAVDFYYKDKRYRQPQRSVEPAKGDLQLTFNVNENYSNYYEIYKWIKSYKNSLIKIDDLMSNIDIYHYDLNKNIIRKIICVYSFPINISNLDLTTNTEQAEPLKFTSTFIVNEILIEE